MPASSSPSSQPGAARRLWNLLRVLPAAIYKGGGLRGAVGRAWLIFRRSGWRGIMTSFGILFRREGPPRMADADSLDRKHYAEWLRMYDRPLDGAAVAALKARIAALANKPLISVLMPVYDIDSSLLMEAIESVRAQIYPHWELCIADDASPSEETRRTLQDFAAGDARIKLALRPTNGHIAAASNSALELATGDWIALMDHDDLLSRDALFWLADAIDAHPGLRLVYSDEDKIDEEGARSAPNFKPDWNVDLFRSQNMFSHLGAIRSDLVRELGGFRLGTEGAQDYDLVLRCIERVEPGQVHHIPRLLYHWRVHAASTAAGLAAKPYAQQAAERVLNEHFERSGVRGRVVATKEGFRAHYDLPDPPPLVSLVIPTRNAAGLVRTCIESIREKTTYPNYEILLVDNGSDDAEALAYFAELAALPGIRVLRDDGPFNFSALNNRAVRAAAGSLVGLVNNDIEVISPDWLSEMVGIALQPGVGAVGARLWYSDRTLQHGGVILGIGGVAGHAHKRLQLGDGGYFQRAVLAQDFSAVTAACLVVRKPVYEQVGGLDQTHLGVAFNDIDFCLRLREAGYRNVWTPYAELFHHESATRGDDRAADKTARHQAEREYMLQRWGDRLREDPAYNPNLSLDFEDFSYAWPPRLPLIGAGD